MLRIIAFLLVSTIGWANNKDVTLRCEPANMTRLLTFRVYYELINNDGIFYQRGARCGASFSISSGSATSGVVVASRVQKVIRTGGSIILIEALKIIADNPKLCEGGLFFAYDYKGKLIGCDLIEGKIHVSSKDPASYESPANSSVSTYKILRYTP